MVRPLFYELEFATKKAMCAAIYLHYLTLANRTDWHGFYMWLNDSRTNKKVGSYDSLCGLSLE
jgi:hypothetical protein